MFKLELFFPLAFKNVHFFRMPKSFSKLRDAFWCLDLWKAADCAEEATKIERRRVQIAFGTLLGLELFVTLDALGIEEVD